MSDNENNEGGEGEMVTKPFKFVTGEFYIPTTKDNELTTPRHSWYAYLLHLPEKMRWRRDGLTDNTGFDARFPNQNQTKHCWQNYVDYHKCIIAKGEDFAPCRQVRPPSLSNHNHKCQGLTQWTVHVGIPIPLPQRLDYTMGRAAR
jgi:hypothetical protein